MIFFEKKIRAIESWENGHNQAGWVKAEAKKKGWAGNVIWISKFYVHKFLSIRIKSFLCNWSRSYPNLVSNHGKIQLYFDEEKT